MSRFTRMSSTDEQEDAIKAIEKTIEGMDDYNLVGCTAIGKSPQTVILDVTHQGSEIYIDADGDVEIGDERIYDLDDADEIRDALKQINY